MNTKPDKTDKWDPSSLLALAASWPSKHLQSMSLGRECTHRLTWVLQVPWLLVFCFRHLLFMSLISMKQSRESNDTWNPLHRVPWLWTWRLAPEMRGPNQCTAASRKSHPDGSLSQHLRSHSLQTFCASRVWGQYSILFPVFKLLTSLHGQSEDLATTGALQVYSNKTLPFTSC